MPDQRKEIARELDRLVRDGEMIRMSEVIRTRSKDEREEIIKDLKEAQGPNGGTRKRKAVKDKAEKAPAKEAGLSLLKLIEGEDFGSPLSALVLRSFACCRAATPRPICGVS